MTAQPITSGQKKRIRAKVNDVLHLAIADLSHDEAQAVVEVDKQEFVPALVRVLREVAAKKKEATALQPTIEESAEHQKARAIMGPNFLGIPEVTRAFGAITKEHAAAFLAIPYDEATLVACKDTHVLVSDIGISLLDVRQRVRRGLFYSYEDAWYNGEKFAGRTEGARWRLIRKTPVPDSTSKAYSKQLTLLAEVDEVPSARQVVYAIILTFVTTGERLFEHIYVRTSDVDSGGDHVRVGYFGEQGLDVGYWYDGPYAHIGLASSRKS